MSERDIKKEADELYDELRKIAELASKRKLTRQQRNAYIRLFQIAALELLEASETGLMGHLNLAKTILRSCEVGLLSEEEGEGRKIEVPKLSDITISQSERVRILQQLSTEEKQPVWIKYWREIVIGILIVLILAVISQILSFPSG